MNFRPLTGALLHEAHHGTTWPAWVLALKGKSGVYIIRSRLTHAVLYVGESHSGRLKKTLIRHFQKWTGKTAGQHYARGSVEVAVEIKPDKEAVTRQNELICQLAPSDNTNETVCQPSGNPF